MQTTNVSIILPAYNEEEGIAPALTQLAQTMSSSDLEYEIIVVDDGSKDRTAEIAEAGGVRVLRHPENRGYGAALKTGIRHASGSLIAITDADGTYPNDRVPDLVVHLVQGDFDMVVGARTGKKAAIPLVRRPAKWFLNKLAEYVSNEAIPDLNSGLRVFRRAAVLRFSSLLPEGFSFTTTLTLAMLANDYLVDYVPIAYHSRVGRSKIRPFHDTANFVLLVLRIALYFSPLKVFLPLSGFLLAIALAWALFSKFVLGQLADVSSIVIGMGAVQIAMVGLLAELINRRLPNLYRGDK